MTAAAIAAQLVDMRNVGTHKVLKLTIHIPEEQALAAIAAFGWPTGVDPVPIAIARLNHAGEDPRAGTAAAPKRDMEDSVNGRGQPAPVPPRQQETVDGAKTKTAFRDMRLANQAGMLCSSHPFQRFIAERLKSIDPLTVEQTTDYVRRYCNVTSRAYIQPRTESGNRWNKLHDEYRTWMHAPELVA